MVIAGWCAIATTTILIVWAFATTMMTGTAAIMAGAITIGVTTTTIAGTGVTASGSSSRLQTVIRSRRDADTASRRFFFVRKNQAMSKRSRFITLFHAATKSFTNFSFESA